MLKLISNHKPLLIIILIILILISIHIALLIDTNSVLKDVKSTYYGEKDASEVLGTPLESYYIHNPSIGRNIDTVDLKIRRYLVIHNGSEGWVLAKIDCSAYDPNGKTVYGEKNVMARWWIEKKEGKWIITKIKDNAIGGRISSLFE